MTRRPHATRSLAALILLVAALLSFASRAAAHDHALAVPASDGLCAICVYGGATLGGAGAAHAVPAVPQWRLPPESPPYRCVAAPAAAHIRIRGPPSPA